MIDLSGRVAVITGGSRGIGAATAIMFARAGADVVITYRRDKTAGRNVVVTVNSLGKDCTLIRNHVEDYQECVRSARSVVRRFGHIDILVNNAGIWEDGAIGTMSPREWKKTIDINLTGTFNWCNAVVPWMKRHRFGKIINISSTAGQRGEAFHSHYGASKGGVIAFTKSIAPELVLHGIWVNCVAPGWVDTDMTARSIHDKRQKKNIISTIPRGKIATTQEIAGPILFLASPLADNIVGEVLNVNGGSVLCG